MKYLLVGLGNIGSEYADTRHNIGFMVNDYLAKEYEAEFSSERYASIANFKYKSRQIYLAKPNTYMNLSGKAVKYWMQELKIAKENLLVIVDDLALDYGTLRMRAKGGSAGHNGLKNIEQLTGGANYPRLRFGVGDNFQKGRQVDYVLSPFSTEEQKELPFLIQDAATMCLSFCSIGIARTMNQYNK